MSDFNIQVKVRNGRLLRAIRAKYGTSANMSRKTGIGEVRIAAFVNFRYSPVLQNGDWSDSAFDISSALHCEPEDLWPEQMKRIAIRRNTSEINASVEQIAVEGPERIIMIQDAVRNALDKSSLTDRQKFVVMSVAAGETYEKVGKQLGILVERTRQINLKSLRTLKHPMNSRGLRDLLEDIE